MANKIREIFESELELQDEGVELKYFIGKLRFSFARGDWKNKNGRIYPSALLKRETQRMQKRIKESPISGMIEHDPQGLIRLDRISHVITSIDWNDKEKMCWAEAQILRTTKGRDLRVLLNTVQLGASMVGHGDVIDGIVQDTYEMQSIDLVSSPSFGDIAQVSASNLIESGNSVFEKEMRKKEKFKLLHYASLISEAKTAGHPNPKEYAAKILKETKRWEN